MLIPFWISIWPSLSLDQPNGFYFLLFLLVVSTFIALIFRLTFRPINMNVESCVRVDRPPLAAQQMKKLKNPFNFAITDEALKLANLTDGIRCTISCDASHWIIPFWGAQIKKLHESLAGDYHPVREMLLNEEFLADAAIGRGQPDLFHECNELQTHILKPPKNLSNEMGPMPRSRYPLVVVILRNDDNPGEEVAGDDVMALIVMIHIRDSVCQMETKILSQLLKQRNGKIFDLRELFIANSAGPSSNSNLCIICRCSPISHAILPCRHACVCGECFERIDKCPLCRCSIISFFRIGEVINEEEVVNGEDDNPSPQNEARRGWLSSLNKSFNRFLGIN